MNRVDIQNICAMIEWHEHKLPKLRPGGDLPNTGIRAASLEQLKTMLNGCTYIPDSTLLNIVTETFTLHDLDTPANMIVVDGAKIVRDTDAMGQTFRKVVRIPDYELLGTCDFYGRPETTDIRVVVPESFGNEKYNDRIAIIRNMLTSKFGLHNADVLASNSASYNKVIDFLEDDRVCFFLGVTTQLEVVKFIVGRDGYFLDETETIMRLGTIGC